MTPQEMYILCSRQRIKALESAIRIANECLDIAEGVGLKNYLALVTTYEAQEASKIITYVLANPGERQCELL